MWVRKYSQVFPGVKKEAIWRLWSDINHWHEWHDDLDYCKLEGEFKEGNYFTLKPKGAPAVKITLETIEQGKRFVDCTRFFGAKMYDTHELEETPEGLRLTNTLVVKGPLKFLWIKLVAQHVADSVPQEMAALVQKAKDSEQSRI
jgi:hypothetical protein